MQRDWPVAGSEHAATDGAVVLVQDLFQGLAVAATEVVEQHLGGHCELSFQPLWGIPFAQWIPRLGEVISCLNGDGVGTGNSFKTT